MYVEVTKEFFYSIKTKDVKCMDVIEQINYVDIIYVIEDVTLLHRTQNGYENFYIKDINA